MTPLAEVSLSPASLSVDPGGEAACNLIVVNLTSTIQRFDLELVGDVAAWTELEAAGLSLLGGGTRTLTIRFHPPREPVPPAGAIPFAIRVTPREADEEAIVGDGEVVVRPFLSTTATIAPKTSRGLRRARHRLRVHNGGNTPAEVRLSAHDPKDKLRVRVTPRAILLDPGYVGRARVRVALPRQDGWRHPVVRPFQVKIETGEGQPLTMRAAARRRAISALVIAPLAAALALLAIGAVAYSGSTAKVEDATKAGAAKDDADADSVRRATAPATTATATTVPTTGEAAAIAMGAPCRPTTDLKSGGKVVASPDQSFSREFLDETTALTAAEILSQHPTVCTIGKAADGDSELVFHPPPVGDTPRVPGSRCSAKYDPEQLLPTKTSDNKLFVVEVSPRQYVFYSNEADRDRALALLRGHDQICWLGGGDDIFDNFFEWSRAVTYF